MNQIDLSGRRAVVTGAARGIGYASTDRLIRSGAQVALWDLDSDSLAEAAAKLDNVGAVAQITVDVSDPDSVANAVAATMEALGGIDILVNNAGIAGDNATVWETDVAEWRRVIDINLNGTFYVNRAVVPGMRARNYGRICNIASIAGKEGNPNAAAYSASKDAVIVLTETLQKELADHRIRVNAVAPGTIDTPANRRAMPDADPSTWTPPERIAEVIRWLASDAAASVRGAVIPV